MFITRLIQIYHAVTLFLAGLIHFCLHMYTYLIYAD